MHLHEAPGSGPAHFSATAAGAVLTGRHSAAVSTLAFSSSGHELVSGAIDGSLLVTRDSGDPLSLPAAPRAIDAVAMLANRRVLAADARGRFRVIAADRGNFDQLRQRVP